MRRERLARGLPAGEGTNLRGHCGLLRRNLVLARRGFQFLERKLHLVDEPRLALVARAEKVALELLDRQLQMGDQSLRARRLGARLRQLGVARQQQLLERVDIVGQRISGTHQARANHKMPRL
jgi:hypothetical protein